MVAVSERLFRSNFVDSSTVESPVCFQEGEGVLETASDFASDLYKKAKERYYDWWLQDPTRRPPLFSGKLSPRTKRIFRVAGPPIVLGLAAASVAGAMAVKEKGDLGDQGAVHTCFTDAIKEGYSDIVSFKNIDAIGAWGVEGAVKSAIFKSKKDGKDSLGMTDLVNADNSQLTDENQTFVVAPVAPLKAFGGVAETDSTGGIKYVDQNGEVKGEGRCLFPLELNGGKLVFKESKRDVFAVYNNGDTEVARFPVTWNGKDGVSTLEQWVGENDSGLSTAFEQVMGELNEGEDESPENSQEDERYWIARPGDNIWKIAEACGIPFDELKDLNEDRFEDLDLIRPGDKVLLPDNTQCSLEAEDSEVSFLSVHYKIEDPRFVGLTPEHYVEYLADHTLYEVVPGETAQEIVDKMNQMAGALFDTDMKPITVDELLEVNGFESVDQVGEGAKLKIPRYDQLIEPRLDLSRGFSFNVAREVGFEEQIIEQIDKLPPLEQVNFTPPEYMTMTIGQVAETFGLPESKVSKDMDGGFIIDTTEGLPVAGDPTGKMRFFPVVNVDASYWIYPVGIEGGSGEHRVNNIMVPMNVAPHVHQPIKILGPKVVDSWRLLWYPHDVARILSITDEGVTSFASDDERISSILHGVSGIEVLGTLDTELRLVPAGFFGVMNRESRA
jgi:hypothetical protein